MRSIASRKLGQRRAGVAGPPCAGRRRSRRSPARAGCRRAGRAPARRRAISAVIADDLRRQQQRAGAGRAAQLVRRDRQAVRRRVPPDRPASARPPAPHRRAAARRGAGTARPPRRSAGSCRSRCWPASGRPARVLVMREGVVSSSASASRSATPWRSTGRTAASGAAARTAVVLGGAEDQSPSLAASAATQRVDRQRIGLGRAGGEHQVLPACRRTRASDRSRASSRTRRAARPAPCTEDGLPVTSSAASIAARACRAQRLRGVGVEIVHGYSAASPATSASTIRSCHAASP